MFERKKSVWWWIAYFVAGGLDPLIVLPVTVSWLLAWYWYELSQSWVTAAWLFGCYVVLPALGFFWMFKTKRINDMDVSRWELREQVYWLFLVSHALGVMVAGWRGVGELLALLVALWFMLLGFLVANRWTKVSLHVGANATLVTLLAWLADWRWSALFILVLLVGWARVYQKHHTWLQVLLGAGIPLSILSILLALFIV